MKLFYFFILLPILTFSQNKKLDTVYCDCLNSKTLQIKSKTIYGKTIAPKGEGVIQEIGFTKQNSKYAFEKEHNSAWYKLLIKNTGELTFTITPNKATDDYDFMLFKANNHKFCDTLVKSRIQPIRACISRDKKEILGITGLNSTSINYYVESGIGAAFCKSIDVVKNEVYYLVLDNVHDNGEGHQIQFNISPMTQTKTLLGYVFDENNKPLQADITLTNEKGDTLAIEKTKQDGTYFITAKIDIAQSYNLNFYTDNTFSFSKVITFTDTNTTEPLITVLNNLKKGHKYSVGSINFKPGAIDYLPRSIPAMNNLYKLLKKNSLLKIKIIGHSNGRDGFNESLIIAFTKARANSIKNYLIKKGIDGNRIVIDGRGDHEMLFDFNKTSTNEQQQEANRRVEIMVLNY